MKTETAISHIAHIDDLLGRRRISAALDALSNLSPAGVKAWDFSSETGRLRESYALMSRYAIDGADDPSRAMLYDDIVESVKALSRQALRDLRMADDPSLYYSTARYESMQPDTVASLTGRSVKTASALSMALLSGVADPTDRHDGRPLRAAIEESARRLFNRVWTAGHLTAEDAAALAEALKSPAMPSEIKHLTVSALFMGELEFHDRRRMLMLGETYNDDGYGDESLALRALSSMIIALWVHRDRTCGRKFDNLFAAIREKPQWQRDISTVNLELARARDTERINRKINDELIPTLMKLRPDIEKRMGDSASMTDPSLIEENPEWQDLLDKSGISDKLKELSEIQDDGGDIMMGTFGNLKSFPFFNEISNWFLPFTPDHSLISSGGNDALTSLAELIAKAPMFCDSDKYSLMCAIKMVPADRRDLFVSQLNAQTGAMNAGMFDSVADTDGTRRANTVARQMQSLYRFFKLFRRKGEFSDIFASPVNLASMPLFHGTLDDPETLELMAEFYFKRGYHVEALELFEKLDTVMPPSAERFQKAGYCRQQSGDIEGALRCYRNSELLRSDSLWTIKRIAWCSRMLGDHEEAARYYRHVAAMRPDDPQTTMSLGHALLESGHTEEALKEYFRYEFLKPGSRKADRPIAWSLLLTGQIERSRQYYSKILADAPIADDFLNAAHLEMIAGDYRAAIALYSRCVTAMDFDTSRFAEAYSADAAMLRSHGVDDFMAGIVLDTVMTQATSAGSHLT